MTSKIILVLSFTLLSSTSFAKDALDHIYDVKFTVEQAEQVLCEIDRKSSIQQVCALLGAYVGRAQSVFFSAPRGASEEMTDLWSKLNLGYRPLLSFCEVSVSKYFSKAMASRGYADQLIRPDDRDELKSRMIKNLNHGLNVLSLFDFDANRLKEPREVNTDCSIEHP